MGDGILGLLVALTFFIGLATGIMVDREADEYKKTIDDAMTACEKSLPRDQTCSWDVVATPNEAVK